MQILLRPTTDNSKKANKYGIIYKTAQLKVKLNLNKHTSEFT